MILDVAHRSTPAIGETKNGDRAYYRRLDDRHLVAVVDGLGHGPGADAVSSAAVDYLSEVDISIPLLSLMEGVHQILSGTRGAAVTLCILHSDKVEACAVGNVEVRSGSMRLPLVTSPGVMGVRVRKFRICEAPVRVPSRLILFSDGISSRTRFEEFAALNPNDCCDQVMEQHRRDYDDSTVLVVDVEPGR